MVYPDTLFEESRKIITYKIPSLTGSSKLFFYLSKFADQFRLHDKQMVDSKTKNTGILTIEDLPKIVPKIFNDFKNNNTGKIKLLDNSCLKDLLYPLKAIQLQAGQKAFILLIKASFLTGYKYFCIYLSRGSLRSKLGNDTLIDFNNLVTLYNLYKQKIRNETIQKKIQIVKPVTYGLTSEYKGKRYPFYITPFIRNFGELNVNLHPILSTRFCIPYFKYAIAYNKTMINVNRRQMLIVDRDYKKVNQIFKKGNGFFNKNINNYLSSTKIYKKRLEVVLLGNAIIYLLAGKRFPSEFGINAGDWMTQIKNNGDLNLILTTVRGGWRKFSSDDEWISYIRHYKDQPGDDRLRFSPFYCFSSKKINLILQKARIYF